MQGAGCSVQGAVYRVHSAVYKHSTVYRVKGSECSLRVQSARCRLIYQAKNHLAWYQTNWVQGGKPIVKDAERKKNQYSKELQSTNKDPVQTCIQSTEMYTVQSVTQSTETNTIQRSDVEYRARAGRVQLYESRDEHLLPPVP